MYGILSEESFEANHQSINKEMSNVRAMGDSSAKANVVMRRLQAAAQSDTVTNEIDDQRTQITNEIDDQRIIKASWEDVRNLVMNGIAPARWQRVFENCAPETLDIAYAFR
jgi:hypothetical protein